MISIIIPVYNTALYLDQCLESVYAQSYTDWECIVVDDGSTDNSAEICDNWAKKDNRFVVIHQENQGVSVARNHGMERSRGEYICFIDSDDWVEPAYLQHLLMRMEDSVDMVVTGAIHEKEKREVHSVNQEIRFSLIPDCTSSFIENVGLFYGPCAILFKSAKIKGEGVMFPRGLSFGEDTTFVFSYLRCVRDIIIAPFADYHYRVQESGTLSYRFGEARTLQRYELWKMRKAFYKDRGMWNAISQKNMYRELWAIVYDGIFSSERPSLPYLEKLLRIEDISGLKYWMSLTDYPKWVQFGILNRFAIFFYLVRKFI